MARLKGGRSVTWAEAETLFPGCGPEWDAMVLGRTDYPFAPSADAEIGDMYVVDEFGSGGPVLVIVQAGEYFIAPEWRRWSNGTWTHPYWMKRSLIGRDTLEQIKSWFSRDSL